MTFENDGVELEVPTMRLRELNRSNASRYAHVGWAAAPASPCLGRSVRLPYWTASCDEPPHGRFDGEQKRNTNDVQCALFHTCWLPVLPEVLYRVEF